MLEQLDLSQKLSKKEYKAAMSTLEFRLAALQRKAIDLQIPVIVRFR